MTRAHYVARLSEWLPKETIKLLRYDIRHYRAQRLDPLAFARLATDQGYVSVLDQIHANPELSCFAEDVLHQLDVANKVRSAEDYRDTQ